MAMGIVSNNDFEKELTNTRPKSSSQNPDTKPIAPDSSNSSNATVIDLPVPGRKEGDVNVPNSLRNVIGESAFTGGRQEAIELGERFGISPSSVSAYSRGATSTASYDERPNQSIINKSRIRVQKRAMSRLMDALHHITPEKLGAAKARDLAGIAKDMSAVVKTLEPEYEDNNKKDNNLPTFVVFAPQFRDERQYEVIVAKE
jgi:hypothetical protein